MTNHRRYACCLSLLLSGALAACGGSGGAPTGSPTGAATLSPAVTASPEPGAASADAVVGRVVRDYLTTRDSALVPGAAADSLPRCLVPGSPAAAVEPLVAKGRVLVKAQAGLQYVGTATRIALQPASFYRGADPVTPAEATSGRSGVSRAVLWARAVSLLNVSDGTSERVVTDHIITVLAVGGAWRVFEDDYFEDRQVTYLVAGGASEWQVGVATELKAQFDRARRASSAPETALRSFVGLLNAREYVEANFYLSPRYGGTAQGIGRTLRSIRFVSAKPSGTPTADKVVLLATLQVTPRLALWNEGINERFITLERAGGGSAWRITAIDTGP